jgi:PAS domain S-box-containing protein
MPKINFHLFNDVPTLCVNDVTLNLTDDLHTHREKLARIVLDELYEFVGLLDSAGRMLEVNQAALRGAGVTFDQIQGKPFWDSRWWAVSKETQDEQKELIRRAGEGEFVRCDMEIYGQAFGEETIVIDYSLKPIFDQNGNVVFLLPEGRNITDKKRAEAEIARKNEELQKLLDRVRRLDNAKSDFFANVSHELRTPLTLILGPIEAIRAAENNLTDTQRRDLDVIYRNASTLLKHVNSLLDLAKVDAGKMTLNYMRIDFVRLLRTVAAHFDALAPQRLISYVIETPDFLEAEVDPERCEQIILNLLSNAFKFTPDGGRIRCTLKLNNETRLLLSVQDSGPGVDPALGSKIFERFQQAKNSSDYPLGGTGLGLSITKDFVDLHGGTISVSEAPGGGAFFQVEIPLRAPQEAYVRIPDVTFSPKNSDLFSDEVCQEFSPDVNGGAFDPNTSARPLVLVVEDNMDMRRFIVETLCGEYRVISAADGAQALALAVAKPPDLVVTDLMMPVLGGAQLVDELRRRPPLAQVPVLVLSAKADETLRIKLLAESVQDYVTKPFSAHELRARVRNLVMMKRTRDALQKELETQNDDLSQLTQQLISSRRALQNSHDALAESEQRWRAVYENSAAGIALTDFEGRILAANHAFQAMLGYREDELRDISLTQITPEEDRETTQSRIAALVGGGVSEYHVQRRYLRKDHSVLWANASVSLIPGTKNMNPMLVRIVEDITARKQAQDALAEAQVELARITRATTMGELVASIAHEINQPLAAVVANGQICLRALSSVPKNEVEVQKAVQRIIRDANRASDIIARIRGFLRRDSLPKTPVVVKRVVEEVFSMVKGLAQTHRTTLLVSSASNTPPVMADRVQLLQVILNLVINGIEAMDTVSDITRILEVEISSENPEMVTVAVKDLGVGFDPHQRDHIFDAFYTTKPEGMGMGLAISRSIIEAHGGQLWATLNDGRGAKFVFTMPTELGAAT